MRVAFGTDEQTPLGETVAARLAEAGHTVQVLADPAPWPEVGRLVGEAVAAGRADRGVVCCWTGTGVSIAANKVDGRAGRALRGRRDRSRRPPLERRQRPRPEPSSHQRPRWPPRYWTPSSPPPPTRASPPPSLRSDDAAALPDDASGVDGLAALEGEYALPPARTRAGQLCHFSGWQGRGRRTQRAPGRPCRPGRVHGHARRHRRDPGRSGDGSAGKLRPRAP